MHACTTSHIAKNMKITRNGNTLTFLFENRRVNIALQPELMLEQRLAKAAKAAVTQLFYQDVLGSLLTMRIKGETFD